MLFNCNSHKFLGHQAYEPGTDTFERVVEAFGSKVVHESGKIDRGELGKIVFGEKVLIFFILLDRMWLFVNVSIQSWSNLFSD